MNTKICMPDDLNDHGGWEQYYAAMYPQMRTTGWIYDGAEMIMLFENDPARFVADLKEKQWLKVWVPGCGMSPIPKLLAELGLEVHATDISPTAIKFQQDRYKNGPPLHTSTNAGQKPGCFECKVHDIRSAYLENYFDLVINVKAFSGFDREAMCQVAKSHCDALKPGRRAHFGTLNVHNDLMDVMEDCLLEAGFVIHLYELNRRLRQRLREIGIPDFATMFHRMREDERVVSILKEFDRLSEEETKRENIASDKRVAKISGLSG